jgi:hypothetical protein
MRMLLTATGYPILVELTCERIMALAQLEDTAFLKSNIFPSIKCVSSVPLQCMHLTQAGCMW